MSNTPADYGGEYFPLGPVRIMFGNTDNSDYIDLPTPDKGGRIINPNKIVVTRETVNGGIKWKDKGFRPIITFSWSATSNAVNTKLLRLANTKEEVGVFPFFMGTVGQAFNSYGLYYRMKVTDFKISGFGGQNIQGVFTFTMQATRIYPNMFDPNRLILIQAGRIRNVTTPKHWIKPWSRVRNATTPKHAISVNN